MPIAGLPTGRLAVDRNSLSWAQEDAFARALRGPGRPGWGFQDEAKAPLEGSVQVLEQVRGQDRDSRELLQLVQKDGDV